MYPFWRATYAILRNCVACKFGEVSLARGIMINCLYHIYPLFQKKKQIDLLDFLWNEMKVVAGDAGRVPIYCPLVQRLINAKMPAAIIQQFPDVTLEIVALQPAASDAPIWLPLV